MYKIAGFIALMSLTTNIFFQGCGDVSFKKEAERSPSSDNTRFGNNDPIGDPQCETVNPDQHKFLYIVDQSGSNKKVTRGGTDYPGNDHLSGKPKRVGSISNFVDQYSDVPEFSHSLITFHAPDSSNRTVNRTVDSDDAMVFTNDLTLFDEGLNDFKDENDGGYTPYKAALAAAKSALEAEIAADGDANIIYNVFFVSDGFPTDEDNGNDADVVTKNSATLDRVREIADLKTGYVFFHTAYYARADNDPGRLAADGLLLMAQAGNGYFTDIPDDFNIEFDLIRVDCGE